MKLVISTQIRENYGAHDWDGKGACPQYWKCKGGHVYVFSGVTAKQAQKIRAGGIPTLAKLIEQTTPGFEEFVIGHEIVDSEKVVTDPWDPVIELSHASGVWSASKVTKNDEYGYMNSLVKSKVETWTMGEGGEKVNYCCDYVMVSGHVVNSNDVAMYLDAQKGN